MTTASPLTAEQRRCYDENGYVLVRGFFEKKELEPWTKRFLDIVDGRVPPAEDMLVMKDVMVAKGAVKPGSRLEAIAKIQYFHNDPVLFGGYAMHP
jgi:phytanoyl-CoA hydroxylase